MRRSPVLLLILTTATLAGCGNKGPLQLPATRPASSMPAAATPASAAPAPTTSTPLPSAAQY